MDLPREHRPWIRPNQPGTRPESRSSVRTGVVARPQRVLVACSDPFLSEALERILRSHQEDVAPGGLEVVRAHDGVTCLQKLKLQRPDLLVLHAGLDRTSSTEVMDAWRATEEGPALPVVVLSAVFGADVPEALSEEPQVHLPFDNRELVEKVAGALVKES